MLTSWWVIDRESGSSPPSSVLSRRFDFKPGGATLTLTTVAMPR